MFDFCQDKCIISVALIADNVTLNEGVTIGNGCVIGSGVVLGAGTEIPPNTRLMAHPPKSDDDDFDSSDDEKGFNKLNLHLLLSENVNVQFEKLFVDADPIEPDYPNSQAYIHRIKSEDSDVESLADELWGLPLEDQEDEEDNSDSERLTNNDHEDRDVAEEDMVEDERNVLCKFFYLFKLFSPCSFL